MSTTRTTTPASTTAAAPQGERGPKMNGASILVEALEREGVDTIFAYPGGASMVMHQALTRSKKIRTILPRHEQGGVFAAEGYARATGKAGVVMATSGPGATNLVTGIADAYLDSTPLVAITGQVPQAMIGKGAFQETDVFSVTAQVVKHNYLVTDINDIARIVKEAFYIAQTGRPGPVLIDIPKNIQMGETQPIFPGEVTLRGYNPVVHCSDAELNELVALIRMAKKPMLYAGGGILSGDASGELREFAERTQIHVATTLMGVGCFPTSHELSLKWLGMHGTVYANNAVNEADLLLAVGVRFDDRVTGKLSEFCKHGTIVHIDIDNSEINKNKVVKLPILSDVKYALGRVNELLANAGYERKPGNYTLYPEWRRQVAEWKEKYPFTYQDTEDAIQPQYAIELLCELTKGDAIITTGVGQHQMWAAQRFRFEEPNRWMTSGGLGTMGYGLPAAVGVQMAHPDALVIDIAGEASVQMTMQEMSTAIQYDLPIKIFILNNEYMGMVRQWQEILHGKRYSHSYSEALPDFVKMADAFGCVGLRAEKPSELDGKIQEMIAVKKPVLFDCRVDPAENCYPMIPSGGAHNEMLLSPDDGGEISDAGKMLV